MRNRNLARMLVFSHAFSSKTLDLLQLVAKRLVGEFQFFCEGLTDVDVEKLKQCINNLHHVSEMSIELNAEQREQSVFLDVLADVRPPKLRSWSFDTISVVLVCEKSYP